MKIGDLVRHNPAKSNHPTMKALYEDWGYNSEFQTGIIIHTRQAFVMVVPSKVNAKPAWYQQEELELISES